MQVTFTKLLDGRACRWEAIRPPRTVVPGPTMAAGADVPHDLATFVIREHGGELDDAERVVNDIHFTWRRGESTPHDRTLDEIAARWRALSDSDELVLHWDVPSPPVRRGRRRRRA